MVSRYCKLFHNLPEYFNIVLKCFRHELRFCLYGLSPTKKYHDMNVSPSLDSATVYHNIGNPPKKLTAAQPTIRDKALKTIAKTWECGVLKTDHDIPVHRIFFQPSPKPPLSPRKTQ